MLEKIIEVVAIEENIGATDTGFLMRVWNTDSNIYKKRLKAIDFKNLGHVLDAGSGFGQWTAVLAKLNKSVTALEYSPMRVAVSGKIIRGIGIDNCSFVQGSIDDIPLANDLFDGVFAYSSILFTDYRKTLKEFHRVLKPGGRLYFNANGLGWYLHNIIDGHNSSESFSSRQMGIETLKNSFKFYNDGSLVPGLQLMMLPDLIIDEMHKIGYEIIAHGGEGTINLTNEVDVQPFFKSEYHNEDGVFEIVAVKR